MSKIFKTRYVEQFQTTATGTQKYYFPDLAELRGSRIYGLRTYAVEDLPYTQLGNTPVATADLVKSYIVLYFDGGEFITLPLIDLITTSQRPLAATATTHPFNQFEQSFMGQVVIWEKSYVWISNTSGLTTGRYFHFNVEYDDKGVMKNAVLGQK